MRRGFSAPYRDILKSVFPIFNNANKCSERTICFENLGPLCISVRRTKAAARGFVWFMFKLHYCLRRPTFGAKVGKTWGGFAIILPAPLLKRPRDAMVCLDCTTRTVKVIHYFMFAEYQFSETLWMFSNFISSDDILSGLKSCVLIPLSSDT